MKSSQLLFLLSLLFGLYQINSVANFVSVPVFFEEVNQIVFLLGGILLVIGGINYLRLGYRDSRRAHYR